MGRHAQASKPRQSVKVIWPPLVERLRNELGPNLSRACSAFTAVVLAVLLVGVIGYSASGPSSSTTSGTSIVAGQQAGTSVLGCDARYLVDGNPTLTQTNPTCTRDAVIDRLCGVDFSPVQPTVETAGPLTIWDWRATNANALSETEVGTSPQDQGWTMVSCSVGGLQPGARSVTLTASEWRHLSDVGSTLSPDVAAKLASA